MELKVHMTQGSYSIVNLYILACRLFNIPIAVLRKKIDLKNRSVGLSVAVGIL